MAIPNSYLTSSKNLESALNAIQGAKAPPKFTQSFLESLGFKSSSDRLLVPVLRMLGFLGANNEPTDRYYAFLDQSQAPFILAEAIEEAYADLFAVNTKAHAMSRSEVKNKLKTLSQGQISESVADKMASTFEALVKLADFSGRPVGQATAPPAESSNPEAEAAKRSASQRPGALQLGGLVYTIELHLPESRDPAVYDALFQSLRTHLIG